MIYHSKKDLWIVLLVSAAVLLPFVLGIYNLVVRNGNAEAGWYLLFVGTLTGAIVLWLTCPLYYKITSSELVVRSGFMHWRIPLSSIEEVHPTRNPLSSPAWSLDRLQVDYRKDTKTGSILISPEDKQGFMRELAASAVGLEMRGERVVKAA